MSKIKRPAHRQSFTVSEQAPRTAVAQPQADPVRKAEGKRQRTLIEELKGLNKEAGDNARLAASLRREIDDLVAAGTDAEDPVVLEKEARIGVCRKKKRELASQRKSLQDAFDESERTIKSGVDRNEVNAWRERIIRDLHELASYAVEKQKWCSQSGDTRGVWALRKLERGVRVAAGHLESHTQPVPELG